MGDDIREMFNKEAQALDRKEDLELYHASMKDHGAEGIGRIPGAHGDKRIEIDKKKRDNDKLDQLLTMISESDFLRQKLEILYQKIEAATRLRAIYQKGELNPLDHYQQHLVNVSGLEWDRIESEGTSYIDGELDQWYVEQEQTYMRLFELGEDVSMIDAQARQNAYEDLNALLDKVVVEVSPTEREDLLNEVSLDDKEQNEFQKIVSDPDPFH